MKSPIQQLFTPGQLNLNNQLPTKNLHSSFQKLQK